MNATDLIKQVCFHYSCVNGLTMNSQTGELRLKVELIEGDPCGFSEIIIEGDLVFFGVSDLEYEPEDALTVWNKETDGEIINIEAASVDERKTKIKLVIVIMEYSSHITTTYVFKFTTTDARWILDSSIT